MGPYVVRRILAAVPVVVGVMVFTFSMLHLSPGDPAVVLAGADAPPDAVDAIRRQLGLTRPLHVQFVGYLGQVLSGDLGQSLVSRKPVSAEILRVRYERIRELPMRSTGGPAPSVSIAFRAGRGPGSSSTVVDQHRSAAGLGYGSGYPPYGGSGDLVFPEARSAARRWSSWGGARRAPLGPTSGAAWRSDSAPGPTS